MRQSSWLFLVLACGTVSLAFAQAPVPAAAPAATAAAPVDDAYLRTCAACHGPEMRGGETGPALIGEGFLKKWGALPQQVLELFTKGSMPPTNPGGLSNSDYAGAVARTRRANGLPVEPSDLGSLASLPPAPKLQEWLSNRADAASTSYSPLTQINRDNVSKLRIAWRWKSDNFGPTPEFYYRVTPLMADGVLYVTAGVRRTVVAIDATNGETLWIYRLDEGARGTSGPRRHSGRGVAFWRSTVAGEASRIYTISPGFQLIALDARTGREVTTFGQHGVVDLKTGLPRVDDPQSAPPGSSSPPVIVGDTLVVGVAFAAGGAPKRKEAVPGYVR